MDRVEVAVVGAGPGGCSAARAAAAGGADTMVIERGVPRADRAEPGADSTDAAGMLDYWIDIMGFDPDEFPEEVVLQELDRARFVGPDESVTLTDTGIDATYDRFGFTFHRARFDDWLRERAVEAGAAVNVGTGVRSATSERDRGSWTHRLTLQDGSEIEADRLILADGPQRQVTTGVLDQFLSDRSVTEHLSPPTANHIAYQEHREFPAEALDPAEITFWWGWLPGETAYPWVFPNDGNVARVGLTMPIGMELDDVSDPSGYRLLDESDDRIPNGAEYLRRLLEELYGDEYDVESDFPLVEDRGKSGGTETYPISSTRPVDSPVGADVAVVGGAMGATSAFHEGGSHVAVATGRVAGELAADDALGQYNDAWKDAIGDEVLRNVAMADLVADYEPDDWNRAFSIASEMLAARDGGALVTRSNARSAAGGLKLYTAYKRAKFRYRGADYVQLPASAYEV